MGPSMLPIPVTNWWAGVSARTRFAVIPGGSPGRSRFMSKGELKEERGVRSN